MRSSGGSRRGTAKRSDRPTYIEHLTEQYVRGTLTLEEFEACAAELIDLGIDARPRVIPVSFDAVLKSLYRREEV